MGTTDQFSFMTTPLPLAQLLWQYEYKPIRDAACRLDERLKQKTGDAVLTASRSMVETTCKTLLDLLTIEYEDAADARTLAAKLLTGLGLHPSSQTVQAMKKTAQGALSMIEGLALLRNWHGDAHGVGQQAEVFNFHHAELCAYSACAVTNYLVHAYEAQVTRKRRSDLTPEETSILVEAWLEVGKKHDVTNPDNLPYSKALEEIAQVFTRVTGLVLPRRDIYLMLVGLRKASKLPRPLLEK